MLCIVGSLDLTACHHFYRVTFVVIGCLHAQEMPAKEKRTWLGH